MKKELIIKGNYLTEHFLICWNQARVVYELVVAVPLRILLFPHVYGAEDEVQHTLT